MSRKRGPGRPRLKRGLAKASVLSIRCAPSERERIADAAKRAGAAESEWARRILLAAAEPPQPDPPTPR